MPVRRKMCHDCPFRGMTPDEKRDNACVEVEAWGCHNENPYGWTDIQCRGHYEARRKYPPTPEGMAKLETNRARWMKIFRAGLINE